MQVSASEKTRLLDDFSKPSAWNAMASDQVSSTLRPIHENGNDALCLDYNFNNVSGFAAMRRELPITFPANYQFDFRTRGSGPANAFEFKLIDASGDNVWWVSRPNTVLPKDWTDVRYKARHISPAWGPLKDKTLRKSQSIEFTISANEGGSGSLCIDDLRFSERAAPPATWPQPTFTATSGIVSTPVAGSHPVATKSLPLWHGRTGRKPTPALKLDFGQSREFGGIVLHWVPQEFATTYRVELSDDAKAWRIVRSVSHGNGGDDPLMLTESDARYLRLVVDIAHSNRFALTSVDIKDLEFGADTNQFLMALAKNDPTLRLPRGFRGEQSYWTLVGTDGGRDSGLIGEDGAIEVGRGGFSVEPFVVEGSAACRRVVGAADVTPTQSLRDDYLPMPAVQWRRSASNDKSDCTAASRAFTLDIAAFAQATNSAERMFARYTLHNDSDAARNITLALSVRPLQVNPPRQFLTTPGGVSPIHQLAYEGGVVDVNGKPRVWPLATPTQFFATPFDQDMAAQHLAFLDWPTAQSVDDPTGLASGALLYSIELKPGESRTISLVIPLTGELALPRLAPGTFEPWVDAQRDAVATEWRSKLDRVKISVPPIAQPIVDTLRTALADILISRDGVKIRPGTRSYARSWIRDGAMTSEALLRLGHEKEARDFLEWFAPFQFANGKVPCCVDKRGSDPVPENDSHGELMFLAGEVYRYTKDRAIAESMWPHVDKAARYMDGLRASERTSANAGTERYGLLPPTISHEGYSAKPAYSYWDDFWGLTGYNSALLLAQALGKNNDAKRLAASRDQFRVDIVASIKASATAHHIDFIPGAADLGDFDATSTTIALSPGGELKNLPHDLLVNTFERYWAEFTQRRDDLREWKDYTPYEWRNVAAFIRLGWRARAHEAIDYFFKDRRPLAWNQWAEVVGRDYREPRFIGDMPHGWVASDFIRSALDLFAYERQSDQSLVIAAGIPATWLEGDGISIRDLRTPYGKLSYTIKSSGDRIVLTIDDTGLSLPSGGLLLARPDVTKITRTLVNSRRAKWTGGELRIDTLPAEVVLSVDTSPDESAH
ncbi:MAG: discoidin domain-containing protein [Dokdonella sp.]